MPFVKLKQYLNRICTCINRFERESSHIYRCCEFSFIEGHMEVMLIAVIKRRVRGVVHFLTVCIQLYFHLKRNVLQY